MRPLDTGVCEGWEGEELRGGIHKQFPQELVKDAYYKKDMESTQVSKKQHGNESQRSQDGSQVWKHWVWDGTSKYPQGCITARRVGGIVAVVAEALAVGKEEDK